MRHWYNLSQDISLISQSETSVHLTFNPLPITTRTKETYCSSDNGFVSLVPLHAPPGGQTNKTFTFQFQCTRLEGRLSLTPQFYCVDIFVLWIKSYVP